MHQRLDNEVVVAAITDCGNALRCASKALRANKSAVLAAVSNDAKAFRYASRAGISVDALEFASKRLLDCSINGDLLFVQTVMERSSCSYAKAVTYFPGLKDALSSLYWKIHTAINEGILQLKDCGSVFPHIFAEQWLSRLWENQWCLNQACKNGSVSGDTQRHIRDLSVLVGSIQTANLMQTYSRILLVLLEKSENSFESWWGLLEWFAEEAKNEDCRFYDDYGSLP